MTQYRLNKPPINGIPQYIDIPKGATLQPTMQLRFWVECLDNEEHSTLEQLYYYNGVGVWIPVHREMWP